jgi:hypothetical protein
MPKNNPAGYLPKGKAASQKKSDKANLAYSKTKTFYKAGGSPSDQARGRSQATKAKKRASK